MLGVRGCERYFHLLGTAEPQNLGSLAASEISKSPTTTNGKLQWLWIDWKLDASWSTAFGIGGTVPVRPRPEAAGSPITNR